MLEIILVFVILGLAMAFLFPRLKKYTFYKQWMGIGFYIGVFCYFSSFFAFWIVYGITQNSKNLFSKAILLLFNVFYFPVLISSEFYPLITGFLSSIIYWIIISWLVHTIYKKIKK
jgi:hypothetical protein